MPPYSQGSPVIGSQPPDDPEDDLDLSNWSLPDSVMRYLRARNLTRLFEWQRDCLRLDGVLDGDNLVFSAPTSAGKTLVADILIMKQVLEHKKKVLIILPFVSVTREKMIALDAMLRDCGVRVGGFMGQHHSPGGSVAINCR